MNSADHNPDASPGRSWRNIRQEVSTPAMSRRGRRRQLLAWVKAGAIGLFFAATAWGVYVVVHSWETDRAVLTTAVHSAPVRDIVVINPDGVLNRKWVSDTLALPRSASLMALDLPVLRDRLLQSGQVRVAVLARNFPDELVVTLQERTPVARVQASLGGEARQFLVAKDGVVYEGLNYDKHMVAGLPWLDGIRLVRSGAGFEPIAGMADVSALLSMAQLQAPNLYREWIIVSLARLADRDEILVKAQDIPEIVFTRKRDYFKQIAQLDYVVDAARSLPEPALQSVNLSLDGQVPVRLRSTPDELLKAAAPSFQLNQPPRKGNRDL